MVGDAGKAHLLACELDKEQDIYLALTCSFLPCREREVSFDGLADLIMQGGPAVLRPGWASGARLAGFWCTGWQVIFARRFRNPRRTRVG
jgi:hypothetical protein